MSQIDDFVIVDNNNNNNNNNDIKFSIIKEADATLLKIVTPQINRAPIDICISPDVSGSMNTLSVIKTVGGEECHGLTTLDLVKHSMKTIIESLTDIDILSIVKFSDYGEIILNKTLMNQEGKEKAKIIVQNMVTEGSTNLWDGLSKAIDLMATNNNNIANKSILILTDGEPNVIPPKGHQQMLKAKIIEYGTIPTINTYGFGYSLDSKLLNDLAFIGNGSYNFIPDASFIGTIFINTLSTLLSNYASNVKISFNINEIDIREVNKDLLSTYNYTISKDTHEGKAGDTMTISFGNMMQDYQRDILLPFVLKDDVYVSYLNISTNETVERKFSDVTNDKISNYCEVSRFLFIPCVNMVMKSMETNDNKASSILKFYIDKIKALNLENTFTNNILDDLNGQVQEAISRDDYYKKWGRHYLLSLNRAHIMQQCNNFKDKSVQHYGNKLFNEFRDKLDVIFRTIPPPKPAAKQYQNRAPVSMSTYNSCSNPCFDGSSLVLMADSTLKRVDQIVKGDTIMSPNLSPSKVSLVVKTVDLPNNKTYFVNFSDGLLITPWHPIRLDNVWKFPRDVHVVHEYECNALFSFVLESNHIMIINNIECITLGHNFKEPVAQHDYFGTHRVIDDLKTMDNYDNGLVILTPSNIKRDSNTNEFITIAYKDNK
jgi:hypothetical protein